MGTETLASIRNTVRVRGDYPRSPKFEDPTVNKAIQVGFAKLYELVADTHEGWFDKDGTLTAIANQSYLALPADCWRVQGLDLVEGSRTCQLQRLGLGDRNRYQSGSDKPSGYRLSARGIEFLPVPNAAYALRIFYTPKVTPLGETTPFEFQNNWDEYVVTYAIMLLHEQAERSITEAWTRLFDPENGLKKQITESASKRDQQEPQYLNLREGMDLNEWGL